jgi:hypothetical protein
MFRALYGYDDDEDLVGGLGHSADRMREKLRLKLELMRKNKIQDKKPASTKAAKPAHKVDERGLDEVFYLFIYLFVFFLLFFFSSFYTFLIYFFCVLFISCSLLSMARRRKRKTQQRMQVWLKNVLISVH